MKRFILVLMFFLVLFTKSVFSDTLKGSRESLQKQNEVAKVLGLPRIENIRQLEELKESKILVPIPNSVLVDERVPEEFRFIRHTVAPYLEELGVRFINKFGRQLQVNSAIRTTGYQEYLQKTNSNAAPVVGDRASTHTTGSTFDIGKKGLSKDELNWLREEFIFLEEHNLIEATEEWSQLVFHIMVFDWHMFSFSK